MVEVLLVLNSLLVVCNISLVMIVWVLVDLILVVILVFFFVCGLFMKCVR